MAHTNVRLNNHQWKEVMEVDKLISKLENTKATGWDGLPALFLKP